MRHAILSIAYGPDAPRRIVLAPGDVVSVGRENADVVLKRDPELAPRHFEIDWDGERSQLRAVAAVTLDGARVERGWVRDRGWLEAGGTVFEFRHELPDIELEAPQTAIWRELSREANLYAVLDGARDRRISKLVAENIETQANLYDGIAGRAMSEVAPHLVSLSASAAPSRLLRRLVGEGWGRGWGIYLTSTLPAKQIRRHLRRFLMVLPEGSRSRWYFRFYDPRVLRDFLPLATPRQRSRLFGELETFIMEGSDGKVLRFLSSPAEGGAAC